MIIEKPVIHIAPCSPPTLNLQALYTLWIESMHTRVRIHIYLLWYNGGRKPSNKLSSRRLSSYYFRRGYNSLADDIYPLVLLMLQLPLLGHALESWRHSDVITQEKRQFFLVYPRPKDDSQKSNDLCSIYSHMDDDTWKTFHKSASRLTGELNQNISVISNRPHSVYTKSKYFPFAIFHYWQTKKTTEKTQVRWYFEIENVLFP